MRYLFICSVFLCVHSIYSTSIFPRYKPSYSYQIQKLLKTLNVTSENLLTKIYLASVTKNSTLGQVQSSTHANSEVTYTDSPISNPTNFKLIDLKLITLSTHSTSPVTTTATPTTTFSSNDYISETISNTPFDDTVISTTPESENQKDENPFVYENVTNGRKPLSRNHESRGNVPKVSTKLVFEKNYKNAQEFKVKTPTFKVKSDPIREVNKSPSDNTIDHGDLKCILQQSSEMPVLRENFDDSFERPKIPQDYLSNSSENETSTTVTPPLTDKNFYTMVTDALLLVVSDMVHDKGPLSFEMKPGLEFTVGNLGFITRAGPIELNHPKNGRQKMIHVNIIVGPLSITRGKDVLKPENDFKFYLKGDMEIRIKRNIKRDVVLHLSDLEIGSTYRQIVLIKGVKRLATTNTYKMIQDFLYQMDFENILKTSVEEALKMDSIHKTFIAIPEFLPYK